MEPILVPRPPKEAFNKNRRVSDLIRAQVNHLKHVEFKLPAHQRHAIPQHPITTEDEAARYIASMTRMLRTSGGPVAAPAATSVKQPTPIRSAQGLDLAAAAEKSNRPSRKTKVSTADKPSASRTTTGRPAKRRKK
jgi:hypothetical protein